MAKFGMGQPIRRREDRRFLTGSARYVDDIQLPGALHLHVLRSHIQINTKEKCTL